MLGPRREREWFGGEDPPAVESGAYKYSIKVIDCVAERYGYFAGSSDHCFYPGEEENSEDTPEYTGKVPQSIKLTSILKLIEKQKIDPKNVVISASFSDDYLSVEVLEVKKQSLEEQKTEYTALVNKLNKISEEEKQYKIQRLEQDKLRIEQELEKLK